MKAMKVKAILLSLAITLVQPALSSMPHNGGWESEPYDDYGIEPANDQSNEIGSRASLFDLLVPKASVRSVEPECNIDRFLYCARQVAELESTENATYANCRSVLNEALLPENLQSSDLASVCRTYMEVNLCAEQHKCKMDSVLSYIERNKKNYPPDLKFCYEKSREICTNVALGPTPYDICIGCINCCNDRRRRCFGDDATVLTDDGRRLKMKQLSVGDRVLSADPVTGKYFYDEVITFGHRDENHRSPEAFVYLTLANEFEVSLTPHHLIYVATKEEIYRSLSENQTTFGQPNFAIDVKPGDYVFTISASDGKHQSTEVLAVNLKYVYSGVYSPLTTSGNIVVDDVLMSCYATVRSHTLAHWVWAPVRFFHKISSFLPLPLDWISTHTDEGIHRYADVMLNIAGLLPLTESFFPSS